MRHDNTHAEVGEIAGRIVVLFSRICYDNFLDHANWNLLGYL